MGRHVNALVKQVVNRVSSLATRPVLYALENNRRQLDATRMLLGQLHAARIHSLPQVHSLRDIEFQVYSQWGEDGIVEYLVSQLEIPNEVFVEFGVEDYREANTRFLLRNRNWRGVVLDGDPKNIAAIRRDSVFWQHELEAANSFITAENINDLLSRSGVRGDVGLLSIDIDGNDYWVWKAIEVVSPRIVICEFNSVFGSRHAIAVPYDPQFNRTRAHYSNLYFGASLAAFCDLGAQKGYVFVGCTTSGVNAFFVRRDCAEPVQGLVDSAEYVPSHVRESKDRQGRLTFLGGEDRVSEIEQCVVRDLRDDRNVRIKALRPL